MKIAVVGLWHLGTVTAACLAAAGHEVVGYDEDLSGLQDGKPPLFEPGLEELVKAGLECRKLRFDTWQGMARLDPETEIVWITYDTPVNDDDQPDVEFVRTRIRRLFPYLPDRCTVVISSQVPVGTTAKMEAEFRATYPGKDVGFAYVPENLRLGTAIESFRQENTVRVGSRREIDTERIEMIFPSVIFSSFDVRVMSPESAEMSKHAINAFLAMQIALTNEIAIICERNGADARDVESALRAEPRIGKHAYVRAGAAFAGGTLARDLQSLAEHGSSLASEIYESNHRHKRWPFHQVTKRVRPGGVVAVWGLSYKAGTDTLRRSDAIALGYSLSREGYQVRTFDPMRQEANDMHSVMDDADALILFSADSFQKSLLTLMRRPLVIDPNGFMEFSNPRIEHVVVGRPCRSSHVEKA